MFQFADHSINNSSKWIKKDPYDFEGLLLQQFLNTEECVFPISIWCLQKQQITTIANLKFVLRNFLVGIHPMQEWTATKKHTVVRKIREKI